MKVDCEGLGSGEVCFTPKLNSEPEFYIEVKSKVPSRPMWKAVAGHTHDPAIVRDAFFTDVRHSSLDITCQLFADTIGTAITA